MALCLGFRPQGLYPHTPGVRRARPGHGRKCPCQSRRTPGVPAVTVSVTETERRCQALGECPGFGVLGRGTGVGGYAMAAVRTSAPWRMPRVWGVGKRYWGWRLCDVERQCQSPKLPSVGGCLGTPYVAQVPARWCQALGECHGLGVLGRGTGLEVLGRGTGIGGWRLKAGG